MRNIRKTKFISLLLAMSFLLALLPESAAADTQTTIICFDPQKSNYNVGDTLEVTIGVSSPDGAYLQRAYCGFGYNDSTMELIDGADSESPDHVWATGGPSKWVWAKLTFRIKAEGKLYFIAGAYSGGGVIQGYRADGSRVSCPRASVVYPIGSGIYTPTSDCNLKSCRIYDAVTGEEIEFNRNFDKYSTSYLANASADLTEIRIEAETELAEDKLILPENLTVYGGVNTFDVGVQASGGEVKNYAFIIHRPVVQASVSNIKLTTGDGTEIPYDFDPDVYSYDINVGQGCEVINYEAVLGGGSEATYPPVKKIDPGYNIKYVDITTDTDKKRYEYYIYRELSALCLSSLVVEGNDGEVKELTPQFDPLVNEYKIDLTSDIRSVSVSYTLGNEEDTVKETGLDKVELEPGHNIIQITVTDGANEKAYIIEANRAQPPVVETEPETTPPETEIVPADHVAYESKDYSKLAVVGIAGLVLVVAGVLVFVIKGLKSIGKTEADIAKKEEKERAARLKREAKERMKASKETSKKH